MPLPSFSTIPARQVQSSKLSRFHMCLSPRGLASTKRSKVQPRDSDRSPVLSWPECRQSSLDLRWCFLSTSSLPAKIRLSSSSCPSPAFLSFYFRLRQFFVKGRGCGVVFSFFLFFLHKYLIFSDLPFCAVCQLQTALFALVGNRILF